ncbi:M48 family metalloprotease [Xanthobacteraceae bacterium A53D]
MEDQDIHKPAARFRDFLVLLGVTILLPLAIVGLGIWEQSRVDGALVQAEQQRDRMAGIVQQMQAQQKPGGGYDFSLRFKRGDKTFAGPLAVSEARKTLAYLEDSVSLERFRQHLPKVVMGSAGALAALAAAAVVGAFLLGRAGRASREMLVRGFGMARAALRPLLVLQVVLWAVAIIAILVFEGLPFTRWETLSTSGAKLFGVAIVVIGACLWTAFQTVVQLRRAVQLFEPEPLPVIGLAVTAEEAPGLWRLLDDLGRRLGALKPDNVVVGVSGGFFVSSGPKVLVPGDTRLSGNTLYLPLPYLALLREDEVATIIGHELAHFSGGDTDYSMRFVPVYAGVSRSLEAVATAGMGKDGSISPMIYPALKLGIFILEQFDSAVLHWSRKREFEADAGGARVTSNAAGGRALLRTLAVEPRISEVLDAAYGDPKGAPADLVATTFDHALERGMDDPGPYLDKRQPHPTDTHPPTIQRLKALGQEPTPAAIAEAMAPPPADGLTRLSAYFARPEELCLEASTRFLGSARDDARAHREALQATVDEVGESSVELRENSLPGAIFIFVFGGLFVAGALALAIIGEVPRIRPAEVQLVAGLAGGLGVVLMLFGIPLLRRGKTPFLILRPDAMVHPGLDRPIPWDEISGLDFYNDKGNFLTIVAIDPQAPLPARVKGARRIKVDKKKRLITFKAIPPRKMKIETYMELIDNYGRAHHARHMLETDRRLSA